MIVTSSSTAGPLTATEIERFRADAPGCANRIHLNNAGAGLMPRPVIETIHAHIDLESRIGGYEAAAAKAEAVQGAYAAVAELVGSAPRNVAFVENATAAYAQALSAIPFESGDTVITSNNDYVSNQIMFLSLDKRMGINVVRAPDLPEGGVDPDAVEEMIERHRPRLVAVTQVPTNSGLVQPVEEVGRRCREHDVWYLVDACQAVGQLPVDVARIGCDFLSTTNRKFLRGPRGSGFLVVSDRALRAGLAPLFLDLHGAAWTDADTYAPVATARRFENWEFAYALVLGTGEAARYALDIGIDRIATRTTGLADQLRTKLNDLDLRVFDRGAQRCGIVTVEVPGSDPTTFHSELERRGINSAVSTRMYAVIDFDEKGVEWVLRLSPHYYNTEEEIGTAVGTIAELVQRS